MREEFLRLFCSNVRGLVCNWESATNFDWEQYDLLAFNEVWGIKDFENLKVENFEVKTSNLRLNRRGGGSIIFGRTELNCISLATPFIEGCIETSGVKTSNVTFINVYRPPSGNIELFTQILTQYINTLTDVNIIIGGDFNINYLSNPVWYHNMFNEYGLDTKITTITRVESGSCIDNFITNMEGVFEVTEICIADHQAISAKIAVKLDKKQKNKYTYRQMKDSNFMVFNQYLYNLDVQGNNVESKWQNLQDSIKNIVHTYT